MNNFKRRYFVSAFFVCVGSCMFASCFVSPFGSSCVVAQEKDAEGKDDGESKEEGEKAKLKAEQKELADKYKLLEEKLFSLHEYEKGQNPLRSKLLKQAFIQSQEKMTTMQLKQVVSMIEKSKLKDAEKGQGEVLTQLNDLLELLQSEDRGKRVRDDITRHQEYLKEVERILRIQKGLRGQTEGGVDGKRLANSQNKTADRTKTLAEEIQENEGEPESSNAGQNGSSGKGEQGKKSDGDAAKDGDDIPKNDVSDAKENEKEKANGDKSDKDKPDSKGDDAGEKDDPKNGDGDPRDSKGGKDGKPDSSADGQGESGEQSGQSGGESGEQESGKNPIQKRIKAAEKKMRDAQQKLEKANRGGSVEDMKAAEREMALAKKELEEILRQLREEEVDRTLAMLEGRFRLMLERQVRVYESTRKLDRVVPEQRSTDFEIKSGKLSVEQASIAKEAGRALLILKEDGSSVAFPATVEEMHQDMLQVSSRLSAAKAGKITIEIEEDIIDTLDYLIEALVKTQQDMARMKQNGKPGSGQPGDKPLVDQLAEIKMLRGLQERIFRRHQRYARFLDDPDDPVGTTEDPDLQAALTRLATKQTQLTDIARDIVNEKNK